MAPALTGAVFALLRVGRENWQWLKSHSCHKITSIFPQEVPLEENGEEQGHSLPLGLLLGMVSLCFGLPVLPPAPGCMI